VEEKLLKLIAKCDVVDFCGLLKILCINQVDENGEDIDFYALLELALDKFNGLKRKQKKQILKLMEDVVKENQKPKEKESDLAAVINRGDDGCVDASSVKKNTDLQDS
jgi:predicted GTPase